jgi:hypothetical protein
MMLAVVLEYSEIRVDFPFDLNWDQNQKIAQGEAAMKQIPLMYCYPMIVNFEHQYH